MREGAGSIREPVMKKHLAILAILLSCGTVARAQTDTPFHASILGGWTSHPGLTTGAAKSPVNDGFNLGARAGVKLDSMMPGLSADVDYFYNSGDFQGAANGARLNSSSVMGNVMYRVPVQDSFGLYGGAGLGLVHTNLSGSAHGGSSVLGWQALGGVDYAMNDRTSLFVEYRYQNAHNVNIPAVGQVGNTSSNVSTGVKINF